VGGVTLTPKDKKEKEPYRQVQENRKDDTRGGGKGKDYPGHGKKNYGGEKKRGKKRRKKTGKEVETNLHEPETGEKEKGSGNFLKRWDGGKKKKRNKQGATWEKPPFVSVNKKKKNEQSGRYLRTKGSMK